MKNMITLFIFEKTNKTTADTTYNFSKRQWIYTIDNSAIFLNPLY